MGSHNPGRFRREGREAFEPHCDPNDFNPYKGISFWDKSHTGDWLEGWKEAEKAHVFESEETTEDYMVMARYPDDTEEEAGEITLRTIINCTDMPIELEIDGVTYKPEF
jgi:hypothetical protein